MSRSLREVAPGVLVATSVLDTTTSTVARTPAGVLLIDPAWTPDELDDLAGELRARGLRPVAGVATHAHHDHVLWHPDFGDALRYATDETVRRAAEGRDALLAELGDGYRAEVTDLVGRLEAAPAGPLEAVGGAAVLVPHDAHLPGSLAVWLPGPRVLVAGDVLSDVELPLLDDSPDALPRYREGLDRLAQVVAAADVVVPGHGRPGADGIARLDADRRYLDALAAGRAPDDVRLGNPAMAAAHEDNRRLARR